MKAGVSSPTVGQTSDLDLAKHRQQPALWPVSTPRRAAPLRRRPPPSPDAALAALPGPPRGARSPPAPRSIWRRSPRPSVSSRSFKSPSGELARLRAPQPAHDPVESIAGGGEGRPDLVLNAVGDGGECRVQGGASVVRVNNLPTGASLLQLQVVGTTADAARRLKRPPASPTVSRGMLARRCEGRIRRRVKGGRPCGTECWGSRRRRSYAAARCSSSPRWPRSSGVPSTVRAGTSSCYGAGTNGRSWT